MGKKNLKSHVQSKQASKQIPYVKRTGESFEGKQYKGGKKKNTPNLIKTDTGFVNKHGIEFTFEERKKLESKVNAVNRKRMKMLEEEAKLPRLIGGVDTGEKIEEVQKMGKESDMIISRRSKSLQRFTSREQYEHYLKRLDYIKSDDYLKDRIKLYKRNHMAALENVFGDDAKDVIMKVRMMKPKDYMELIQSDEDLEINYIYDPSARAGKLNRIRQSLGMKEKEYYEE